MSKRRRVQPLIVTFTDFGPQGPYLGQMEMACRRVAPVVPVVHLLSDAPVFDPRAAGYMLAALVRDLPPACVVLGVVDPGVGGTRLPVALKVEGRWLVGPDNGLFEPLCRRAGRAEAFEIVWRPQRLAPTFHGRDLFAPVAARLALGAAPEQAGLRPMVPPRRPDWPEELERVIYLDHYGNAWTGIRAAAVAGEVVNLGGHRLHRVETFGDVAAGEAFWYENSSGLVEIAVNGGRADSLSGIELGAVVTIR